MFQFSNFIGKNPKEIGSIFQKKNYEVRYIKPKEKIGLSNKKNRINIFIVKMSFKKSGKDNIIY